MTYSTEMFHTKTPIRNVPRISFGRHESAWVPEGATARLMLKDKICRAVGAKRVSEREIQARIAANKQEALDRQLVRALRRSA